MDLDERDGRVCLRGDEPVEVSKEYGPLVFWSVRVTAATSSCEWIVEQETPEGGWRELARFAGQPTAYYEDDCETPRQEGMCPSS